MPDETFEDMILDISWKDYDSCFVRRRDLESKAGTLLAATGVLFGLIVNGLGNMNRLLAFISLGVLVGVAYLSVSALKLRKYAAVDSRSVWKSFSQYRDNLEKVKSDLHATLSESTEKNLKTLEDIVSYLHRAFFLFFLALVLIVFALITHSIPTWVYEILLYC